MAVTATICNSYKKEVLDGVHLAADTYKVALIKVGATGTYDKNFTNAGTPGTGSPSSSNLGTDEASGTGYSSGGATVAATTALTGDVGNITFADPSWASSSISAIGAVIYNSTRSNKAVMVIDFGGTFTSTNGTFTVDLPASGASALIRIS